MLGDGSCSTGSSAIIDVMPVSPVVACLIQASKENSPAMWLLEALSSARCSSCDTFLVDMSAS
jgi:hypothetical protein